MLNAVRDSVAYTIGAANQGGTRSACGLQVHVREALCASPVQGHLCHLAHSALRSMHNGSDNPGGHAQVLQKVSLHLVTLDNRFSLWSSKKVKSKGYI